MAFANLLDQSSYSRRDPRNVSDLLDAQLRREQDVARSNALARDSDLQNDAREITLQQSQAIQPGILSELGRENQTMLTQPPPLGPHPAPSGLPPYIAAPQATPNALPPPMDAYAGQQGILDERGSLLGRNKDRAGALALSPVLAQIAKGQSENLASREDLAGDRLTLQGARDFEASVPDLESIKNSAVQLMKGQDRGRSIDTWNGMMTAIQSAAIAKNPALLQNKGFQEYMSHLEKLKPSAPSSNDVAQSNAKRQTTQQVIGLENQLRDEYEKVAGESRTVARAAQDIAAALKTNNSLSVRTAVTKFSKIADPTTGVLGGEANATEKAAMGDLLNTIEGNLQRMTSGGMTPDSKRNFEAATRDFLRVQKSIFERVQQRTKNRFQSYQTRFPDLNLSLDAVMGSEDDRRKEIDQFNAMPENGKAVKVLDKSQFDALPPGSLWIDSKGTTHRKK